MYALATLMVLVGASQEIVLVVRSLLIIEMGFRVKAVASTSISLGT